MAHEDLEPLAAWCRDRQGAMLGLLRELVEQSSYTDHAAGGAIVADMLVRELESIAGLQVKRIDSARHAPHVVAWSRTAEKSPSVALVGHLDTVFPPGTFEGFVLDGELAHGPGVVDMKGGLVVAIEALRGLSEHGALDDLSVKLVVVSDEEIGSPEGAVVIGREVAGATCALVLEAGRALDAVVTARKGTGGVVVIAHGKAAHAGNHHADGANAIWALARFVDRAQSLTDYARGVTVNVGKIHGGHSRNTVPDRAEATLDLRFVDASDGDELVERLQAIAGETSVAGTSIELTGGIKRPPMPRSLENVRLYQEYAACARAAGLGDGEAPLAGGGSDAATTAALGIPSIDGLGPRGTGFHTHKERIEVATLTQKLEALARFLWGRAGGARGKL